VQPAVRSIFLLEVLKKEVRGKLLGILGVTCPGQRELELSSSETIRTWLGFRNRSSRSLAEIGLLS
jgi:hypothetical protein